MNAFRITGTSMPPSLLLMCKVLAVAILATGHIRIFPEPFLPFVPGLDQLVEPALFRCTLQITGVAAAVALLLNRWVRTSACVLGCCFLVAVVSSKAYYGNNKTFVGLCLVLAALSDKDRPAYLLRWQLALVYFGAALNKLLLPNWQSGVFFDYWGTERIKDPLFSAARDALPPLLAGKIVCWGTIAAEFAASIGLLVPRFVPAALWINALFQIGLLQFTGGTFTLFFYAMQAAALAFIPWPNHVEVTGAGRLRVLLPWLNPDGLFVTRPAPQGGTGLEVRDGGSIYHGVAAFCRLLIYSPTFWLCATALLAGMPTPLARRLLVAAAFVIVLVGFRRR